MTAQPGCFSVSSDLVSCTVAGRTLREEGMGSERVGEARRGEKPWQGKKEKRQEEKENVEEGRGRRRRKDAGGVEKMSEKGEGEGERWEKWGKGRKESEQEAPDAQRQEEKGRLAQPPGQA